MFRSFKTFIISRGINLKKPSSWLSLIKTGMKFFRQHGRKSYTVFRDTSVPTPDKIWERIKPTHVELTKMRKSIPNLKNHYTFTIIVFWNDEDTISSVNKQIYENFEIIMGVAPDLALEKATGDYVIFLQSGNHLLPNALFELVLEMNRIKKMPSILYYDHDGYAARRDMVDRFSNDLPERIDGKERGHDMPCILQTLSNKSYYDYTDERFTLTPVTCRMLGSPSISSEGIQKVVIVKCDVIGDAVVALPAIRSIRESLPNARIDLLCSPRTFEFYSAQPEIDNVIIFPYCYGYDDKKTDDDTRRKLYEKVIPAIEKEKYDLSIDFGNTFPTEHISAKIADYCIAYSNELIVSHPLSRAPGAVWSNTEAILNLVSVLDNESKIYGKMSIPQAAKTKADERLKKTSFFSDGLIIGIHPGAGFEIRTWPLEMLLEFCGMIVDSLDAKIVFFGGEKEKQLCENFISRTKSPDRVLSLAGSLSLLEYCYVVSKVNYYVGMDGGPSHIAGAQEVASLVIFGPGAQSIWAPIGKKVMLISNNTHCSPCSLQAASISDCPERPCLNKLTAEDIYRGLERLMTMFPKEK